MNPIFGDISDLDLLDVDRIIWEDEGTGNVHFTQPMVGGPVFGGTVGITRSIQRATQLARGGFLLGGTVGVRFMPCRQSTRGGFLMGGQVGVDEWNRNCAFLTSRGGLVLGSGWDNESPFVDNSPPTGTIFIYGGRSGKMQKYTPGDI